jgi:hypothetical protein
MTNETVGIVDQSEDNEVVPQIAKETIPAPDLIMVDLPTSETDREVTKIRKAGVFTLSCMRSQNVEHPDFVCLILGWPGEIGAYMPLTADRCEQLSDQLLMAAKDLRGGTDN